MAAPVDVFKPDERLSAGQARLDPSRLTRGPSADVTIGVRMAEAVLAVGQDSPMEGRGRELRAVEQVLARLAVGRPAVVEVTGEPGIGKTQLLYKLARAAARRGYVVARGAADEGDRDIPYAAIIHALDPLIDALDPRLMGGLDQEQLAAMFPSLPGHRVARGALARPERRRLFAVVRALLVQLARRRPVVLALDDLQWADGGLVELLSYLLRRPPAGPVLLALAYRPRQVGAALVSAIDTTAGTIRLELGPLSLHAATSLLDRLDPSVSPAACADLHAASGGNPCYLLALAPGGETAPSGPIGTGLPAQVRRTLRREVDALPVALRDVALLAAVAGDVVRPEIVAAVAQLPEHTVRGALDGMAASDLVRETEVPGAWRFRHPVLRQSFYDSMPLGRRLATHRRTALVLEACGVPLVERAHHVECAAPRGDGQAVALLADAARASLATAPATAVRWYEAALRLSPERDDTSGAHRGLLVAYADALVVTGRLPDAAEVLVRARSSPAASDPVNDTGLVAQAGRVYNLHGQHDRAADLLYPALASLPDHGGSKASALTLELAQVAFWRRDYHAMHRFADQALDGARSMDTDPLLVDAAAQRAFAGYQLGATAGQVATATRYAELAMRAPITYFPRGRLHAQRARAIALCSQGRHREALTAAAASVEDAQAVQAPVEVGRSRLLLGHVHRTVGDREQAVRTLTQVEADLATIGADRERDLAARELRALGMCRPRRSRPARHADDTARLSPRERQVSELVAAGLTNRHIAAQLAITDNTVETHLRRIFAKLEVSSRAAVAAAVVGSSAVAGSGSG